MRRIICIIFLLILSLAACSTPQRDVGESPDPTAITVPTATIEPVEMKTPSPDAVPVGVSRPGFVAETDEYTFFTDYKNIFRMDNRTGETVNIFTSSHWLLSIMEYAGDLYTDGYRMDYNGNHVFIMPNDIFNISFAADGFIYYNSYNGMSRKTFLHEEDEYNKWNSDNNTFNVGDAGSFSDPAGIGYYKGKVYFQDSHQIYSLDKDGVKTYCWDGDYISLNDSKLVYFREGKTYSKDLDTGNEKEIYVSEMPVSGNYIGAYKEYEYYEVDGKIIFISNNLGEPNEEGQLPFEYVGTAVVSNEWIYITCQDGFIKYNIDTQLTIPIADHLATGQELFVCNNHIYYIDERAFGINRVDLSDNSRKQIFRGSIYLDYWYI